VKSYLLPATSVFGQGESSLPVSAPVIEHLFDHVPETAFFIKDSRGRYLAVNESLVDRCGVEDKSALIGRDVFGIFPRELAELYWKQDQSVLRNGRAIVEHLELHWYAHRRPGWCLTTKLAMRDADGAIIGLAGISRDLRAPGDADIIPAQLASTLEYLEANYSETVTPGSLAKLSGLPSVRFARLIKRIFRLTPNQLIVQTRLAAAARLLIETKRSMADIACDCGFYDHSALTRAFRSATHLTPSKFRALSLISRAELKQPEAARASEPAPALRQRRATRRS
jgi:AraC-like DNA-binding protein